MVGTGQTAMIITGTWDIPSIKERNPAQDIRFMMVPGSVRTVPNINVGTYRVISSRTEHPEEAKQFVAFMNGRATQEKLAAGAWQCLRSSRPRRTGVIRSRPLPLR